MTLHARVVIIGQTLRIIVSLSNFWPYMIKTLEVGIVFGHEVVAFSKILTKCTTERLHLI